MKKLLVGITAALMTFSASAFISKFEIHGTLTVYEPVVLKYHEQMVTIAPGTYSSKVRESSRKKIKLFVPAMDKYFSIYIPGKTGIPNYSTTISLKGEPHMAEFDLDVDKHPTEFSHSDYTTEFCSYTVYRRERIPGCEVKRDRDGDRRGRRKCMRRVPVTKTRLRDVKVDYFEQTTDYALELSEKGSGKVQAVFRASHVNTSKDVKPLESCNPRR